VGQILGHEKAKAYELMIEYDPQPPYGSGNYVAADEKTVAIFRAMLANEAKKDLSTLDLVKNFRVISKLRRK